MVDFALIVEGYSTGTRDSHICHCASEVTRTIKDKYTIWMAQE